MRTSCPIHSLKLPCAMCNNLIKVYVSSKDDSDIPPGKVPSNWRIGTLKESEKIIINNPK